MDAQCSHYTVTAPVAAENVQGAGLLWCTRTAKLWHLGVKWYCIMHLKKRSRPTTTKSLQCIRVHASFLWGSETLRLYEHSVGGSLPKVFKSVCCRNFLIHLFSRVSDANISLWFICYASSVWRPLEQHTFLQNRASFSARKKESDSPKTYYPQ